MSLHQIDERVTCKCTIPKESSVALGLDYYPFIIGPILTLFERNDLLITDEQQDEYFREATKKHF